MPKQTIPVRNGHTKHRPKTERRTWVRSRKEEEVVWCQPASASANTELDSAWLGKVRDISTVGIGLSMRWRFEPGSALIVELAAGPDHVMRVPVHVIHATPEGNERWIIGCTFDRPLSEQELQTFLGEESADQ